MSMYDIGALIISIRAALPGSKLRVFDQTLYTSPYVFR